MIWLAYRQHRAEGIIIASVLALLTVFLLITGLDMANTFQQLGLGSCVAQTADPNRCGPLEETFFTQYNTLLHAPLLVLLLPALLGALTGAPLVARELEQHTYLLAWTQNVTRLRWLSVKLALVFGAGLLAAGIVMALLIWWYDPYIQFNSHFGDGYFDLAGPVMLASVIMVLSLGIAAGTLTRRTVLAIFLALALFLAIRLPVALLLRPNYLPPITVTWPIGQDKQNSPPITLSNQDWIVSRGFIDTQGNKVNKIACSVNLTPLQCFQANGVSSNYITYQPANRYWPFQWIETGIYLAISALALGLTFWWVRRRIV